MLNKIIYFFFLILGLCTLQIAFIGGLPSVFSGLNVVIVALIFILALKDFSRAAILAVGAGLIEDVYSFSPFGLHIVSFFLTLLAVHFLYVSFFTNRSLYSFLALASLASLTYILLEKITAIFAGYFSGQAISFFGWGFLSSIFRAVVLNVLLAAAVFYVINFISHRFKPVFLVRRR
ncbi:MAG: hypothetical protein WCW25_04295 [Patescibacteria group bacterium]|jgi:cell shape-determining protein MreD